MTSSQKLPGTSRTEGFSDGVFAIAITLLVLGLHRPSAADIERQGSLLDALLRSWPSYLAYLTAFLTIGVTWLNHHGVYVKIAHIDTTMQVWNLLLLLVVSFAPFPTELVSEVLSDQLSGEPSRTAAMLFVLASGLRPLVWIFAWGHLRAHPDLLVRPYDSAYARREQRRAGLGCVSYVVGLALAVVVPIAAIGLSLVIATFYVMTARGTDPAPPGSSGRDTS